ncbi:MAG: efflux RND transporter periplasmic adaptor subunit [Steroidobacteraceae bacterium]
MSNSDFSAILDPAAKRKRHRLIAIGVVVGLVAVTGLGWWLVRNDSGGSQDFGPGPGGRRFGPATTVGVATAEIADIPVTLEALGTVLPTATVTVRPQVSGTIQKVLFKEGQMVNVGDPLVLIDPRPYDAARLQAEGNLKRDQASLEAARLTLKRYQVLLTQDSIAGQDVDTQAATVKQLEGTVLADQAALDTARLNVEFTRITSPVRGRTGLRVVDVGNYIAAGDTSGVVVVTVLDPIDVEFSLPQDQVPAVAQRLIRDKATLPVTALDRTRATELASGTFSALDNQVNTSTGTVKAKARFTNQTGALFPNQFVNVRLLLNSEKGAVVIPVGAVRSSNSGSFVYVLNKEDSTVKMRTVKVGASSGDKVAITDGLQAGEQVISEGGDRLTDGARVQLPGQASNAGAGQQGQRSGKRNGQNGNKPAGNTPAS